MNIAGYRDEARKALPAPLFHYIDGGADDEWTMARNTAAFESFRLLPKSLVDVSKIDLSTRILGSDIAVPFFLSPTGMSRLFHVGKELAAARAAEKFSTFYSLSTMATTSIESIGAEIKSPKIFQVYLFRDKGLNREFISRCKAAGYDALCLTIDTPVAGNRERDKVFGMTMPPRLSLRSWLSFAAHPRWTAGLIRDPHFNLANVAHRVDALRKGSMSIIEYINGQFDRTATWEDAAWLIREWGGPFAIKGIQSVEDARKAIEIGATAITISNHGGRQLDGVPGAVELVEPIRAAIGATPEIILDGGIRRGTHVVKALCLGANACSIGRPYLYGLAHDGQRGVEGVLTILSEEVRRTMMLMGCSDVRQLNRSRVA
jgi:L-lactate dehydrogenase (cytochrome)